jgi:predicted DNA-binding transcriptional regulator YafY
MPAPATADATLRQRPPLQRMLRIHKALQSSRCPNPTALARDLEVSTKSVHRDLEFMRDQLAETVKSAARRILKGRQ